MRSVEGYSEDITNLFAMVPWLLYCSLNWIKHFRRRKKCLKISSSENRDTKFGDWVLLKKPPGEHRTDGTRSFTRKAVHCCSSNRNILQIHTLCLNVQNSVCIELWKSENVHFRGECNEEVGGGEIYGSGLRDKSVPRHWDCWDPLPLPRHALVSCSVVTLVKLWLVS